LDPVVSGVGEKLQGDMNMTIHRHRKCAALWLCALFILLIRLPALAGSPAGEWKTAEEAKADGHANLVKFALEGAIKAYSEAIRLAPDDYEAYLGRGKAYVMETDGLNASNREGNADLAIADLTKAVQLSLTKPNPFSWRTDPEWRSDPYYERGRAYHVKRDYDKAIADFTKSIELGYPIPYSVYKDRSKSYLEKGELDKAIADLNTLIDKKNADCYIYRDRGKVYAKKGELEKAIADFTEAINSDKHGSGQNEYYTERGNTYMLKGDVDKAIADFSSAIGVYGGDAALFELRGNAFLRKGEKTKAEEDFDMAKKLSQPVKPIDLHEDEDPF
jgi:tetratricopeptide (TPR) repeat protein